LDIGRIIAGQRLDRKPIPAIALTHRAAGEISDRGRAGLVPQMGEEATRGRGVGRTVLQRQVAERADTDNTSLAPRARRACEIGGVGTGGVETGGAATDGAPALDCDGIAACDDSDDQNADGAVLTPPARG
jgi:hypothetical protein